MHLRPPQHPPPNTAHHEVRIFTREQTLPLLGQTFVWSCADETNTATNYMALLRKMTYKDKASYASCPQTQHTFLEQWKQQGLYVHV